MILFNKRNACNVLCLIFEKAAGKMTLTNLPLKVVENSGPSGWFEDGEGTEDNYVCIPYIY